MDVLHRGHIELFSYGKSLCDVLYVALDSDRRIKLLKGASRPINNENDRKYVLSSIRHIDDIYIFGSDDELINLIKTCSPDIMIVGGDWKGKHVIGSAYAKQLLFFNRIEEYSSTKIIEIEYNQ